MQSKQQLLLAFGRAIGRLASQRREMGRIYLDLITVCGSKKEASGELRRAFPTAKADVGAELTMTTLDRWAREHEAYFTSGPLIEQLDALGLEGAQRDQALQAAKQGSLDKTIRKQAARAARDPSKTAEARQVVLDKLARDTGQESPETKLARLQVQEARLLKQLETVREEIAATQAAILAAAPTMGEGERQPAN